ncbi:hypothetical protein ACRXCV_00480 (plasmid) [Halobacteriovorax sp. GFR7]|uniref:hypothetical protein n=1 Tax=unclassified Halobacteriovorax TaxID=2639665 RepID=UPI003D99805E
MSMKGHKVQFNISLNSFSLEEIFQRYIAHIKDSLSEEQTEALRGCFFSGASAVLHIFDQITCQTMEVDQRAELIAAQQGIDSPEAQAAQQELDHASGTLVAVMTHMMQEVCDGFGVPNQSKLLSNFEEAMQFLPQGEQPDPKLKPNLHGGTADLHVVKPECKDTFDLEGWNPKDDGNIQ